MRAFVFNLLSIVCAVNCLAQGERNNWFFGDSIGITFNTGSPTLLNNITARSNEPAAAISTKNGTLLFYGTSYHPSVGSDITRCYNAGHTTLQNANGLFGSSSVTQGQIILSNPANSNSYYLFSISYQQSLGAGLFYNTIDMLLDSGLGAVVQKNVLLCDTVVIEKMTAVKHGNGRDWWLLVHSFVSNDFYEYLITPAGITGPTVLSVGSCIGCNNTYDQGQMVFSKDGSKLCMANTYGILEVFDFDRCTGSLTLNLNLGIPYNPLDGWTTFYGCSFSADGQVLYASRFDTLWQYNLNASNVKASRLYLMGLDNAQYCVAQHMIGPDNKIYICLCRNSFSNDSLDYKLSVINYPDSVGYACDLRPHSIWLGGHRSRGGLPNLPHYELGPLTGSLCDTLAGINDINDAKLLLYPNPANKWLMINGKWLNGLPFTLTVYDVLGKTHLAQNTHTTTIDISTLTPGLYVLRLQQGDKMYYGRFVKE